MYRSIIMDLFFRVTFLNHLSLGLQSNGKLNLVHNKLKRKNNGKLRCTNIHTHTQSIINTKIHQLIFQQRVI